MSVPWDFVTTSEDTGIPNGPSPEGRELGYHLALYTDIEAEKDPTRDQRCDECALRAGTFANQCAGTLMDVLKCVVEGKPFHCHKGEEPVCSGFALLRRGR